METQNKHTYDLAIIDYRLPDMTGDELQIALTRTTPQLKTMILTKLIEPLTLLDLIKAKLGD